MMELRLHCDLMANLFKPDSKFRTLQRNLKRAMFRHVSTCIDHALVVACCLTQIPAEGSGCEGGSCYPSVSRSSHRQSIMREQYT